MAIELEGAEKPRGREQHQQRGGKSQRYDIFQAAMQKKRKEFSRHKT
jgi:hypothetical protein